MERNQNLVPIEEALHYSDRVRFNLPLPSWVETENIGVDLKRTEWLMNSGGIKDIKIRWLENGNTSSSMPVMAGVNPDGSLLAGAAKTQAANLSEFTTSDQEKLTLFKNNDWTSLTVLLNRDEIQNRISNKDGNLKNAGSWVPHIDKALREDIGKAGREHLLSDFELRQKIIAGFFYIDTVLLSSADMSSFRFPIFLSASKLARMVL